MQIRPSSGSEQVGDDLHLETNPCFYVTKGLLKGQEVLQKRDLLSLSLLLLLSPSSSPSSPSSPPDDGDDLFF